MYFIKNLKKYFFFLKPNSMAITFIMVLVLGMSSFSIDARLNPILHATDAINYDVFFDSLSFLPNNTDKFIFRNLFFFCYHFFLTCFSTLCFKIAHIFSIGLRSGSYEGQARTRLGRR